MAKLRVGLLFGGCSGEHEVSIRSAQAIARGLSDPANADRYELTPVYIQKDGRWLAGESALNVLSAGVPLELGGADASAASGETSALQAPNVAAVERWQSTAQVSGVDVWFPVLHGPNGEDGTVQGMLTLMQAPFVGSGVLGS
ncbi:MAG: D-alanine--D-alanine ligase, partial [Cyanobacteriota bacterium]